VGAPGIHARVIYAIYDDGMLFVEPCDGFADRGHGPAPAPVSAGADDRDGRKLGASRVGNSPARLVAEIARAGRQPRVMLAAYGWYWAADALATAGAKVRLAHPLGVKGFAYRRVKNERDAADLADLLRMGRLPEARIALEIQEITRYRCKVVGIRTSCRDQVHAVLAKLGVEVTCSDIFGAWGSAWLDELACRSCIPGRWPRCGS